MIYRAREGQVSSGEAIGILLTESVIPYIPGDVANATTYSYPVRFKKVPGLTIESLFNHDTSILKNVVESAMDLKRNGVRAITGDCGFMAIYQRELAKQIGIPIFMSSLIQIPFMERLIGEDDKIGVITANSRSLDRDVLQPCGADIGDKLVIRGLENSPHFAEAFLIETGELNKDGVESEVVSAAKDIIKKSSKVKLLLSECSVLAPYGPAVQEATGLPVFDYITMINYVYSAVIKQKFIGYM